MNSDFTALGLQPERGLPVLGKADGFGEVVLAELETFAGSD